MGCVFCSIVRGETSATLIHADDLTMSFLDVRPVFLGHTLVIPRAHHETLPELPHELLEPFFGAVRRVAAAVVRGLGADGSFLGVNNIVSQSVPHLHVHVVPRTKGDGLRGFFWPRTKYGSEEEMRAFADSIRKALETL